MPSLITVGPGSGGNGTRLVTLALNDSQTSGNQGLEWIVSNPNSYFAGPVADLSNGANVVSIPSSAGGALIQLPSANSNAITLTCTGLALAPNGVLYIPFASTPSASFTLNSTGSTPGVQIFWH